MNSAIHLVVGVTGGAVLYLSGRVPLEGAVLFGLWQLLLDLDHILYFIIKHRTVDPARWLRLARKYHKRMQANLYVFHSPEWLCLLGFWSLMHPAAVPLLVSNILHVSLDVIEHRRAHRSWAWAARWSVLRSLPLFR